MVAEPSRASRWNHGQSFSYLYMFSLRPSRAVRVDAAAAAAYGWSADISDEDALRELLAINGRDP